jgi:hypothetical protein
MQAQRLAARLHRVINDADRNRRPPTRGRLRCLNPKTANGGCMGTFQIARPTSRTRRATRVASASWPAPSTEEGGSRVRRPRSARGSRDARPGRPAESAKRLGPARGRGPWMAVERLRTAAARTDRRPVMSPPMQTTSSPGQGTHDEKRRANAAHQADTPSERRPMLTVQPVRCCSIMAHDLPDR